MRLVLSRFWISRVIAMTEQRLLSANGRRVIVDRDVDAKGQDSGPVQEKATEAA